MSEALVSQRRVAEIIGWSRLQRLRAAGWLEPAQSSPSRVLFSPRAVHAALSRLEREACPPDKAEAHAVDLPFYQLAGKDKRPVGLRDYACGHETVSVGQADVGCPGQIYRVDAR